MIGYILLLTCEDLMLLEGLDDALTRYIDTLRVE